jgi:UDP-N-acetylglucosamine--N-acetylmuramyl-(pentapeptide) pyrophosphoryl-undecaprenol N-acetylglucosamine transferase
MRILISGGGTAGHIYPGIALAETLDKGKDKVLFVGTKKGLESRLIPKAGYPFETIEVEGFSRKLSVRQANFLLKLSLGFIQAAKIIKDFKPEIVIGTGGYVCGPVVLAASLMGIPTVIHEQNAVPGMTNKLLSHFVKGIAVTYEDSLAYFPKKRRFCVTGNPVRKEIIAVSKKEGREKLGIKQDSKVVLIFGGSQGAKKINTAIMNNIHNIISKKDWKFVFISGPKDYETIKLELEKYNNKWMDNLVVYPYIYEMQYAIAAADLIVCRGGATTLAEITVKGIPAIIIPYPYATGNHQEKNAQSLVNGKAAVMIKDSELDEKKLWKEITKLLTNKDKLEEMHISALKLGKSDAAQRLLQFIIETKNKR